MLWVDYRVSEVIWDWPANVRAYKQEATLSFPELSSWIPVQDSACIHEHLAWAFFFLKWFLFKDNTAFLKSTIQDNMTQLDFILYQRVLGPVQPLKTVLSARCVSRFEVTQAAQQKSLAKGGGYCQRHQLSQHTGQAAPGTKGETTDDNVSQCNLLTPERLGPDSCAFIL